MSNGNSQSDIRYERIDADAVCANCGAVNPEDTLLCKTCGNNLRDQRTRRVQGDYNVELPVLEAERKSWIGKAIVLVGIVALIWTALFLRNIENFMAGVQTAEKSDGEKYWTGADAEKFDGMLSELTANPVSRTDADKARSEPVVDSQITGRYALFGNNATYMNLFLGTALARQEGDKVYFVALVSQGQSELRGVAQFEGTARVACRDTAALKLANYYFKAQGFAQRSAEGGYACYGMSDYRDEDYAVLAYRVSE